MLYTQKTLLWFENYTDGFAEDGKLLPMLVMTKEHSVRVRVNCLLLAESMGWHGEAERALAFAIGLLHDTARFPQYSHYKTFLDSASVDHGDLGADILAEKLDWSGVDAREKEALLSAVRLHNKKDLPQLSPYVFKWVALARDADKIDIFRMVQSRIENGNIFEMLPRFHRGGEVSQRLVAEIERTGRGSFSNAESLEDYRLIQLTWGSDINYPCAADILRREKIFEKICSDLEQYKIEALLKRLLDKIR